jgi:hypothetical protein
MCFSVAGHSDQNLKKADLSLKMNFIQIFRSRFGFLVQSYPELEIKIYAQGRELLIFGVFFLEKLAHFGPVLSSLEMEEKFKKSFFEVFVPVQIPYFWALNWALAAFGT